MKHEIKQKVSSLHEEVCALVDKRTLAFRAEMGSAATSTTLVKLNCYLCGFQGDSQSVFANHVSFPARLYRIIHVNEGEYLLPERISSDFSELLRKQFPHAKVELGRFVTFG